MPEYFTKQTEEAIVKYNNTKEDNLRHAIYNESIHKAFDKLVENIIFSFKLTSISEDYQTLKDKTIGHLVLKIEKFNPNRKSKFGKKAKAFSFFGTVAKNFIMMEYKKACKLSSLDYDEANEEEFLKSSSIMFEKFSVYDNSQEKEEFKFIIVDFLRNEQKENEMKIDEIILDAIESAFEKQYDITNKKALFLYLREATGLTTPEISGFLTKFRPKLKNHIRQYAEGNL